MSHATQQPTFHAPGAPVSVLLDFDGTISLDDVGDRLLSSLVEDQDVVRHMDQLYLEGAKGSRELIAWDMEVLPRDREVLLRAVDALPLDESLAELVATVREVGGAIEVVSDGVGFHVERMLARLDLADLPVATNASLLGQGGAGVDVPLRPSGLSRLWHLQARAHPPPPGGRAGRRLRGRRAQRPLRRPSRRRHLRQGLAGDLVRGRERRPTNRGSGSPTWPSGSSWPCSTAACPRTVSATRTGRPRLVRRPTSFICGPEVWGEGREVAPGSVDRSALI